MSTICRLKPAYRLRKKKEYLNLFQDSSKNFFQTYTVFSKPNFLKTARLGITIKGRIRAVDRTRLKRQVREFFRKNRSLLPLKDYNFFIKAKTLVDPCFRKEFFTTFQQELKYFFNQSCSL